MIRSPAGFSGEIRNKQYTDYYQAGYGPAIINPLDFTSPLSLFASGAQGVWYDPSDFSTMFQDDAGTTPVTTVEQSVGLLLDKSKGLALGAELVTNGGFDSNITGWTVGASISATWSNGEAQITTGGVIDGSNANWFFQVVFVADDVKRYSVSFDATWVSGAASLQVGSGFNVRRTIAPNGGVKTRYSYTTARGSVGGGVLKETITFGGVAGSVWLIDNVSVREIAGNHASQATPISRPVLTARVNQLLATATLSTQSVTTLAATYTLSFSGTGTITTSGTNVGVYSAGSHSLVCTAGTLTLTVAGSVTLADLRLSNAGVGLPAYQAVVTSTNYDTNGFPLALRFDGSNDGLATGTITPGVDKAQVFAGVQKLSDLSSVLVELSASVVANAGSLNMLPSSNTGGSAGDRFAFSSRGSAAAAVSQLAYSASTPAPATQVWTATSDISGDLNSIRLNGVASGVNATGDQGTGNFLPYPLYIGRRGGTTLPFNGHLYGLIVRFAATITPAQIASTENWLNNKTKAY